MYQKQVDKVQYDFFRYVSLERWTSYYYQVKETLSIQNMLHKEDFRVLEIGIGNGITKAVLKQLGLEIKTMDIDEELRPDFVGSLPNVKIPEVFDCIICFEVLEHIKFEDVGESLQNFALKAPFAIISVPNQGKFEPHKFDGEHYWELESQETSLEMFEETIKNSGYKILKNYLAPENPYHRFFVLERSPSVVA